MQKDMLEQIADIIVNKIEPKRWLTRKPQSVKLKASPMHIPITPWGFDTSTGNFEISFVVKWGVFYGHSYILDEEAKNIERVVGELLNSKSVGVSVEALGSSVKKVEVVTGTYFDRTVGTYNSHQFKIQIPPEVYAKHFYKGRQAGLVHVNQAPAQDFMPLAKRGMIAQNRLREMEIFPTEDMGVDPRNMSDDDIFRDLELAMLGAKSSGIAFSSNSSGKNAPWEVVDGYQVARFSNIQCTEAKPYYQELAARMKARLQEKYMIKGIDVQGTSYDLVVRVNTEENLRHIIGRLVEVGGKPSDSHIAEELMKKIEGMTRGIEIIDAIEISLGVGGNTHDYYEDALAVICANGKKLPLHIEGSIGSDLRILIESVNNSDVAEFAPEMKITLKVPKAVATAANLGQWTLYNNGLCALPAYSSNGHAEFNIYTNNVHELARPLAAAFDKMPKFGFKELLDLQGVKNLSEIQARCAR